VLQVKGLSVTLGRQTILQDVDLEVLAGQIHAIVGPNGAGKTTLMRSLIGAIPHRGEIRFRFRGTGRVGYVPQLLEFDHELPMTVVDLLATAIGGRPAFAGIPRTTRSHIADLLARTGCAQVADRLMGGLSGGELRRILLAQALSPLPEVLLLDEPVSNVDPRGAGLFEELVVDLRAREAMTIVMVGRDIQGLPRIADQVAGINREVTYSGPPSVLGDPRQLARVFGGGRVLRSIDMGRPPHPQGRRGAWRVAPWTVSMLGLPSGAGRAGCPAPSRMPFSCGATWRPW
jgi:zinc transport system ATP-binding protein